MVYRGKSSSKLADKKLIYKQWGGGKKGKNILGEGVKQYAGRLEGLPEYTSLPRGVMGIVASKGGWEYCGQWGIQWGQRWEINR